MIILRKSCVAISFILMPAFVLTVVNADTLPTLAVLYFENNSLMAADSYKGLEKGLCEIMITQLSKIGGIEVVERERLEQVFEEIALGQSGAIDESSAPKVGKILGAQMLVLGSFMKDRGNKIRIDTRLVRVETGEILTAEEATGTADNIFSLTKKLTFKIAHLLDIDISSEEKKKLKKRRKVSFESLVAYSQALDAFDRGDMNTANQQVSKALDNEKDFHKAQELKQQIEDNQ
ncbi:MAG: hypothetical protein GF401_03215 [Chitinivibrionales bacterium]|nr:hypothetical protein [Chitinivibrionales bacterium]